MLPSVHGEFTVGTDPSLRFSAGGMAICSFRAVASSRKKDDKGEWVDDKSAWVNVTGFKQVAEIMAESVEKGQKIVLDGRLEVEPWTDRDANDRISVNVLVNTVGPSLSFATAKVSKVERSSNTQSGQQSRPQSAGEDPWATPQSDDPPF